MGTSANAKRGWALVTGASSGLGVEFARQLASRGYDLVLVARRRDKLAKVAAEISEKHGIKAEIIECDLGVPGASGTLMSVLETRAIDLEVLVNNAGFGHFGLALDAPLAQHTATIQLNVTLLTELTLATTAKMVARGSGTVLNVASTGAFQPCPYTAVYAATKSYVVNFSLALNNELSPRGVRVLTMCPGPTKTEFFEVNNVRAAAPDALVMTAERCVAIGLRSMDRGRALTITGFLNTIGVWLARSSPLWLVTRASAILMKPRGDKRLSPRSS